MAARKYIYEVRLVKVFFHSKKRDFSLALNVIPALIYHKDVFYIHNINRTAKTNGRNKTPDGTITNQNVFAGGSAWSKEPVLKYPNENKSLTDPENLLDL